MLAILVDHISWEACEARVLHRGVVPAAHVLAVLLQHLHRHRVQLLEEQVFPVIVYKMVDLFKI